MSAGLRLVVVGLWVSVVIAACGSTPGPAELGGARVTGTLQVGTDDVEIRNGKPELQALVAWALDRFVKAGLAVPTPRSIGFSPYERKQCHGYAGLTTGPGLRHITLCFGEADACPARPCPPWAARTRQLVLHELAHTWMSQHLDPQRRQRYLDEVGMTWWSEGAPWERRGVERAAETLVWALDGRSCRLPRFGSPDPERLTHEFGVLTGRPPPER
jgi:hypothetical protein